MEKINIYRGIAAPLRRSNVDTDQIIPAIYMRSLSRTGFKDVLFENWRTNDKDFVLNQNKYKNASILVAGPEFATGSSREHAVWALKDFGFRVIISSRFADIFRNNSGKNGLLTAVVDQNSIEKIWDYLDKDSSAEIEVNLEKCIISVGDKQYSFEVDDYTKHRLLEGLDDIDLTLKHQKEIDDFYANRPEFKPKTLPAKTLGDAVIESAHYDN